MMDWNRHWCQVVLWSLLSLSQISFAGNRDYPHQPVPFTSVQFTDHFWLPRMETNRTETIPFAFKMCEETHRIENFKVAGGLSQAVWQGRFGFNDSDVYKVIEGAAYALMIKPDPKLDAYLDEVIRFIAAAQEEDGYLYTAWTAKAREHHDKIICCYDKAPWDNLAQAHQLYNLGHMYEAAVAHYQATGKRSFLAVAIKSADLVCRLFGPGKNEEVPGHQEIEIGLVKLYRATRNEQYLQQARWFLSQRGQPGQRQNPYDQSHKPVIEQTEAVGHAVRATYMYSAMADVAALTGDRDFVQAIDALWHDVAHRKLYITGGVGARHAGEAYGDAYELPNRTAYCETCAAIANVYWNHRMFLFHGDAKYIDVMERALYNNVLAGVALDGMTFFYPNPLESADGHARSPWFGCACCPSNICRFMASVPGYVYAVKDEAVYVNLFVDSQAQLQVGGGEVSLKQSTRYPWEGRVVLTLSPTHMRSLTLKLRIPDWAQKQLKASALYRIEEEPYFPPTIQVNGQTVATTLDKGYVTIARTWQQGDTVVLDLPMPIRRIYCDKRVPHNFGKTALQRGPLVYCLEGYDVTDGRVLSLMLPEQAPLTSAWQSDLLQGVTTIQGQAIELQRQTDSDALEKSRCDVQAIPYYAWAHRGKSPMVIWLPTTEKHASPLPAPTIASTSQVTTSFLSEVDHTRATFVNDQALPASSRDRSKGYLHWWPHKGNTEWLQYDFKEPSQVRSVALYWFDDTGTGECRIPQSWVLQYRKDGQWLPVENTSDYTITKDGFDRLDFKTVTTDALRITITFQPGFSSGVHEWIVN